MRPDFEAEKEIIIIRNLEDLDEKSLINFFFGVDRWPVLSREKREEYNETTHYQLQSLRLF